MIREAEKTDLEGLLKLYTQLHDNPFPEVDKRISDIWENMINDPFHHVIVAEENGIIVSSCICVVIPNLTHDQRPYALIENVITHKEYRCRGLATACLDYARNAAIAHGCYKIMLLTGSKEKSTLDFYEHSGYNRNDKTAFIQWL